MKILALDFSSDQRSAAVITDETGSPSAPRLAAGGLQVRSAATDAGGRNIQAVSLMETALGEAGVTREEVDRLVVGLGPGSYAGIRISIALAQGWQLARGIPVQGIPSVGGIAARAFAEGVRGSVQVAIDAQRNEFYLAGYALDDQGWTETMPLRLASHQELLARVAAGDLIIGPEATKWVPQGRILHPCAAQLGLLAAQSELSAPGEALEPVYLRPVSFVKSPPSRRV